MERITTSETLWDVLGKAYDAVYRLQEIENILGDEYDLEHLKSWWKRTGKVGAWLQNSKSENTCLLLKKRK